MKKPTSKTKNSKGGRKEKPVPNVEQLLKEEVTSIEPLAIALARMRTPAPTPEPQTLTMPPPAATKPPREKEEPWEKTVPFAKDVKENGVPVVLTGPAGTFTVHYHKVEAAQKDQRWTVADASGAVVASRSDYWVAVLDARRRSMGK